MKKLLVSLMLSAFVATPALAAAPSGDNIEIQARINSMLAAVNSGTVQVSVQADRYNSSVADVMHLNGISRTDAIARIARATIAQNGFMPAPPIPKHSGAAYDPAPHAFRDAYSRYFYAGVDAKGEVQFTATQRDQMGDNFWYCSNGQRYFYGEAASTCK